MILERNRQLLFLLGIVVGALVVSGVGPYDFFTWLLEVLPVLIALPILIVTAKNFPLTLLVYWLIAIHALILVVGGHYTYAEVPAGFWVQDWLELSRNPYDRLGHLAQGFVPAMVAREILIRRSPLVAGKWLFFLVTCVCLAISAFYEFIEWWVAVAEGGEADAFLGTQGDVWDTQWDMFTAFCGAMVAQLILATYHDRAISRLLASNQR
jgi:putative membrane protein